MSKIQVTIDRLVLRGLDPADRHAFLISLKSELARTLADSSGRSKWARSHRTPILRLKPVNLNPGPAGARVLGSEVAKGIRRGLKP
jgi:hypothetical protein